MDISINPSEVQAFARQLSQWATQMKNVKTNIVSKTRNLEQHWKDADFLTFVEIVKVHGQNLGTSIEHFEKVAKQLLEMAKELEEQKRRNQRRMNNMQ